jgi:hypothetical protein
LSGFNRPVEKLNRNSRQANQLLSQQNLPIADMLYALVRRIDGEGMPSEAMPMV